MGGHNVHEETIRLLAFLDNSLPAGPRLIASGGIGQPDDIRSIETWGEIMGQYEHGRKK